MSGVTLRPVASEDAALHVSWLADPAVTEHLAVRYPVSEEAVAEAFGRDDDMRRFTVLAGGDPVGYVALRPTRHVENRGAELDLVIGERSAWGRGYGTAATRAACAYGFDVMGLHRIHLWVVATNAAAIRVYERCGFVHEGVARDRLYRRGAFHDCALMGRLA